jgi:hypothetical protein
MLRKAYGPQTLSGRYEVLSNGYFFFFLADFFAFFAFFAFLAMLPSVTPKLAQCRPTFDMHSFRLHHDYKIDTASFKEGKRPAASSRLAPRTKLSPHTLTLRAWLDREGKALICSRRSRRREAQSSHGAFDRMVELIDPTNARDDLRRRRYCVSGTPSRPSPGSFTAGRRMSKPRTPPKKFSSIPSIQPIVSPR